MLMIWKAGRNTIIFILVIVIFILILLLPKNMEIQMVGDLRFEANYPFTIQLYKQNFNEFIDHFQTEKGFGTTPGGEPLIKHMQRFLLRSLKIIAGAFILSMGLGTVLGVLLFHVRNKKRGRIFSFISWMLASVPDFFLFITMQYIII